MPMLAGEGEEGTVSYIMVKVSVTPPPPFKKFYLDGEW
jgi:hypothetical protein